MKKKTRFLTLVVFVVTALFIVALMLLPRDFFPGGAHAWKRLRNTATYYNDTVDIDFSTLQTFRAGEEPRVALADSEIILSVLSGDFNSDGVEEQIIAYRGFGADGRQQSVSITFVDYNAGNGEYTRVFTAKTPVTVPGTLALYTEDLIGDHRDCILVTGMNEKDEKTMSVFRWIGEGEGGTRGIRQIAEIVSDGSISIQERERPLAYGQGLTNGPSYSIQVRAHDTQSNNDLDQVETTWLYNAAKGVYERNTPVRIAGARIENQRLRGVLGGSASNFEQFVGGLWYHVSQGGTIDSDQYIYFDIENREIIFYGDDTQQVYNWRTSRSTRFGIYVSSENISVPTMNRIIDIELESADSIRVRVFEDVRMRIQVSAPWDGSYRKAASAGKKGGSPDVQAFTSGIYSCALGRLQFFPNGSFELRQEGGARQEGSYAFFALDGNELLEIIPKQNADDKLAGFIKRETYRVERTEGAPVKLFRVRLGTQGIQEYHETPLSLTAADQRNS